MFREITLLITDASAVLLFSICFGIYFSWRKSVKKNLMPSKSLIKRTLYNLGIPLIAGGIFALIFLLRGDLAMAITMTLTFYGLALINVSSVNSISCFMVLKSADSFTERIDMIPNRIRLSKALFNLDSMFFILFSNNNQKSSKNQSVYHTESTDYRIPDPHPPDSGINDPGSDPGKTKPKFGNNRKD